MNPTIAQQLRHDQLRKWYAFQLATVGESDERPPAITEVAEVIIRNPERFIQLRRFYDAAISVNPESEAKPPRPAPPKIGERHTDPAPTRVGPEWTFRGYTATAEPQPNRACICERNEYAVQCLHADEFNERRDEGVPEWEVPDWVRAAADWTALLCPAAIHFPSHLTETWLGRDVETSDDPDKQAQLDREQEDLLAAESSADKVNDGWESWSVNELDRENRLRQLMWQRRDQLVAAIRELGRDPKAPETVAWVEGRMRDKAAQAHQGGRLPMTYDQIKLRAYTSCLYQLLPVVQKRREAAAAVEEDMRMIRTLAAAMDVSAAA